MKELRIKDICDKGSSNLKQKDVEGKNGQYPVYGAGGIISYIDTYHQEDNYIAIVKDGSGIGRVTFMPAKSSVIGTMQYILPKEGFNINYIGYCLQSLDLSKYKQGAAIPHIYFRDYGERIVKVTEDLNEQQSIVDYLDSAFAKIDAMKANAEKALNEAKALFQASLKEMLEPKEGWEEKTLKALTNKIGSGATPRGGRKIYIEKGCHLIRSMNVQYDEFKYENLAHITDEAADQLKGVEIQDNDVLFNITGASIARCCVVPTDVLPARVNQHVSILRLKQDVLPRFLSFTLNSPKHQKELLKIGEAGSTRQALTKMDLENHIICYPNIDGQTKILFTLDSIKSKVDRLQANYEKISKECDALKQAVLRQVFE
ncbi:MAG: restriction endonuclease subunit S [Bacteroidales bacterium]|nr:restriction endonuclease subunit S [Bacteroidales bacterium]